MSVWPAKYATLSRSWRIYRVCRSWIHTIHLLLLIYAVKINTKWKHQITHFLAKGLTFSIWHIVMKNMSALCNSNFFVPMLVCHQLSEMSHDILKRNQNYTWLLYLPPYISYQKLFPYTNYLCKLWETIRKKPKWEPAISQNHKKFLWLTITIVYFSNSYLFGCLFFLPSFLSFLLSQEYFAYHIDLLIFNFSFNEV